MHLVFRCLAALSWLLCSTALAAPTNYWTGAVNGLWSESANWQGNLPPIAGNTLVFPSNAVRKSITNDLPASRRYSSLLLESSYSLYGAATFFSNQVVFNDPTGEGSQFILALPLQFDNGGRIVCSNGVSTSLKNLRQIQGYQTPISIHADGNSTVDADLVASVVNKTGPGRLSLTNPTNSTQVVASNGMVVVNGACGTINLYGDASLAGTGRVFSVLSYGTNVIEPGHFGPGILTIAGSLGLQSNSTLRVDLQDPIAGQGYDQLRGANGAYLGEAKLEIIIPTNFFIPIGSVYNIISNNPASCCFSIHGFFSGTTNNSIINLNGTLFRFNYSSDGVLRVTAVSPTFTWTGNGGNGFWSNPGNWLEGAPPQGTRPTILFNGSGLPPSTNDLPGVTIDSIRFASTGNSVQGEPVSLLGGIWCNTGPGTNIISGISLQNSVTITNVYSFSNTLSISNVQLNGFTLRNKGPSDVLVNDLLGSGALLESGSGRLWVSGLIAATNIPMVVTRGTLMVNAAFLKSPVQLQGGQFVGAGTLQVIQADAGTLSPGPSIQVIRTADLKLNAKVNLEMEVVGSASDKIVVTGSVDLGSATLRLTNSFATGGTYTLIENDGEDPVIGIFADLPEGAVVKDFPAVYQISYHGGSGNDVVLTLLSNIVAVTRGPYLQNATTGSVVICWRTSFPSDGKARFGTELAHLDMVATDPTFGTNHFLQLTGLLPGTKYYYSVGTSETDLSDNLPEFHFITPPNTAKPTRLWAIGDAGTGLASQAAVRDAYAQFAGTNHTDVWLMLGDNAYNSGSEADYQNNCFNVYSNALRNTLLWTTIGNHDVTFRGTLTLPYLDIFVLPTLGEGGGIASGTERYYSFNYGNVHLICLDAMNSDTSSNGPMCTWLKSDLEAVTNDWVIAFWHHPPYSKGTHDSDLDPDLIAMRENAVPILESYGVDLVLCGHSHVYERSFLLRGHYGSSTNFSANMKMDGGSGREDETGAYLKDADSTQANVGAVYVVAGSSGFSGGGSLNHPAMFYSTPNSGSFVADIDGLRLDGKFLRSTGAIEDHFTIIKQVGSDVPRIVRVRLADGQILLRWPSTIGASYEVQETTSLEAPVWTTVDSTITAAGTSTTWTSTGIGESKKFFRIRRLP